MQMPHSRAWYPEEGNGCPGTRVTDGYEPSRLCRVLSPGPCKVNCFFLSCLPISSAPDFKYVCVRGRVHVGAGFQNDQRLRFPEAGITSNMSCPGWVLGTEFRSPERAVGTLNLSPALRATCLTNLTQDSLPSWVTCTARTVRQRNPACQTHWLGN